MALLWERLWSGLWPVATLAGVFLALALADVLPYLPGWLHAAVLVLFAVAILVALVHGLKGFRWPTRREARHRLEERAAHRPLTASEDHMLQGERDPVAEALWREHARRAALEAQRLRGSLPRPGVPARDPRGLRAVAVLALFVTGIAAWDDPWPRIDRAFNPALAGLPSDTVAIDLWVTPPEYTGLAPFYREGATADADLTIEAPQGSRLLLLVHGADEPRVRLGDTTVEPEALADESHRLEAPLEPTGGDAVLAVRDGGDTLAEWPLRVAPDAPPTVAFAAPPSEGPRWRLQVPFQAQDDFGLTELALRVSRTAKDGTETETVDLPLPAGVPQSAKGQPLVDLTPHPWAGLPVTVTLAVRDALDQEGVSDSLEIVLPERAFQHPVAREVIRQRKALVSDPDERFAVAAVLDTIAAAPHSFGGDPIVFLGMRIAAHRLRLGNSEASHDEVVDLLWHTALRIEEGDLAAAEEALAEAERRLDQALQEGASPEEIQRLAEELKRALQEYMQALAERMPEMDFAQMPAMPQNMLDPQAMSQMLDQLSEMSELGAEEAARQMMEQLRKMLQALRNASPMPSESMQALQEMMRELKDLADAQEKLLQETFERSRQEAARQGSRGNRDEERQQGADPTEGARLAERQEALRHRLGDLMARIGEQAGQVPENLGNAELEMRQSTHALAGQSWTPAEEAQGRALEALRKGTGQAMQQMMQAMGQGMMMMPMGLQPGQRGLDPLGRGFGGFQTEGVKVPTKPDARRARDIMMELQRRSNEIERPADEREYLRRLLKQF